MSELTDRIQEWSRRNGYIASGLIGPLERDVIVPWHEAQVKASTTENERLTDEEKHLRACTAMQSERVGYWKGECEQQERTNERLRAEVQSLKAGSGCALCDPTEVERLKAKLARDSGVKTDTSKPRLMRCPKAGECKHAERCMKGISHDANRCPGHGPGGPCVMLDVCPACVPVTPEPESYCRDKWQARVQP